MENEEATAAQLKAEVEKVEKQQTKLNELMKSLATDSGDACRAGPTSTVAAGELVSSSIRLGVCGSKPPRRVTSSSQKLPTLRPLRTTRLRK